MPDYTGGYTSAVNDQSRRRYEDASTQYTLEQLTQAQLKRRQAEEDRQRQIEFLARQVDQSTQLSPPPPGAAPPMPGAPSQPMMMPPGPQPGPANVQTAAAPPMSAPQGMPLGAPQGPPMQPNAQQNAMAPAALAMAHMLAKRGPMQVNVSPQGGISGGQLPQGALAQPPAPQPWQARPGGPFAGGGGAPPAAAAGGGIAPPPMGGAGGQGGEDMGLQPAKVINPMEEAGKLVKQGMTPEEAGKTALAMLPIWERMNKSAITNFTEQARIAREVIEFRNAKLREDKERRLAEQANQPKPAAPTAFEKEVDQVYPPGSPENVAARKKHLDRLDAPTTVMNSGTGYGGGEYSKLTDAQKATVDFYATVQAGGDSTWRTGLSRVSGGANLIKAVDERVPTIMGEYGMGAGDYGSNKAMRTASQAALTQNTKDLASIEPFAKMLDQNADILKGLATKVIKTDAALGNRPINWIAKNMTGDPDVADFMAQMRLVQTEAARVITNPRLVGQLTDTARTELEDIINGNMALGATNRVIDRLKNDSQRRVGNMREQQQSLQRRIKSLVPGGGDGSAAPAGGGIPAGWSVKEH